MSQSSPPDGEGEPGMPYSGSNSKDQDSLLLEPYSHILTCKGKNIRGKLIAGFNLWMKVSLLLVWVISGYHRWRTASWWP